MSQKRTYFVAFLLAGLTFAASGGIRASEEAVQAEERRSNAMPSRAAREVRIPFVNAGGIRDWRPNGNDALYVQDAAGRWYRATLTGSCSDLPYSEHVAFLTQGTDSLDKFSAVAVRGQRCQFTSLVRSEPPPRKARPARHSRRG